MANVASDLKKIVDGDVSTDNETLKIHSHDASTLEVKPAVVVFPKTTDDVGKIVKYAADNKKNNPNLSVTARAAGTDMSGGPLNSSIIISFGKYLTKFKSINNDVATTETGILYRDFEKETLKKGLLFPTYPSSREICAIGGIVNNNSAGEKSFTYGNSINFIDSLKIVFADGNEYETKPLSEDQLKKKMSKNDYEGNIYKNLFQLITENYDAIQNAKPITSKNASGYYLWEVWNRQKKIFNLTKLIVGAQGTLGIVTEAQLNLIPTKKHAEMLHIHLDNIDHLGEIINTVIKFKPENFESYDDNTIKYALKYFSSLVNGPREFITAFIQLLPEFIAYYTGKLPKLALQVEFTGDDQNELNSQILELQKALKPFKLKTVIAPTEREEKIYWKIRRDSFALLKSRSKDRHAIPFVDDIIVHRKYLVEFLPKLNKLFVNYPQITYTVAGHIGDGNFHIIPLMDIVDPKIQAIIPKLGKEVFDLVLEYKGSTSAEHNDGIIRTPYVKQMYGEKIYKLFEETKKIFDPDNIFNPGKKVGGTMDYAMKHIRVDWT